MDAFEGEVLNIVERCLEVDDPEARAARLHATTDGRPELRARVEALLERAGANFRLLATQGFVADEIAPLPLPERLGPFRIVSVIGDGGMGTVALAERDDGVFEQRVAVKLIRADLGGKRARQRFADERRILARLAHPGIARILDGGEVEDRPWLAMDFIDGAPVTEALDKAGAGLRERIAAFLAIADAVAHAHRNLVVHADIKPGNALMTADGEIKLLDFGIARLIVDLDSDEAAAPYPLTRGYAPPERADGAAPTIAGDVYSLGILLKEMLPGQDAVTPDLAAIISRAAAPQAEARYPDVSALIVDIKAWRSDMPVAARGQTGWRYRAGKFLRRHRKGVLLTAGTMVLLALTAAISTSFYLRAERERAEASARFEDARGTARYLLFDLMPKLENQPGALRLRMEVANAAQHYLDRLTRARDATPPVRLEAATGLWRLAEQQGRPGYPNLGQADQAEQNLLRAAAVAKGLAGPEAAVLRARIALDRVHLAADVNNDTRAADNLIRTAASEVARAATAAPALRTDLHFAKAVLNVWRGSYDAAIRESDAALAGLAQRGGRDLTLTRARLIDIRAEALFYNGDIPAAERPYRDQIALLEAGHARWPNDNFMLARLARARWALGSTLLDLNRAAEAESVLHKSVTEAEQVLAFDRADREALRRVRVVRTAWAQALAAQGRSDDAIAELRLQARLDEARLAAEPDSVRASRDFAYSLTVLAEALEKARQREAACATDRRALALFDTLRRRGKVAELDESGNVKRARLRSARNCAVTSR